LVLVALPSGVSASQMTCSNSVCFILLQTLFLLLCYYNTTRWREMLWRRFHMIQRAYCWMC